MESWTEFVWMHNPPHRGRFPDRIAVEPVLPVDILGAYVLLPVLPPVAGTAPD